jgi:chromate transporter
MSDNDDAELAPPRLTLAALFARFLRYGCLAFGGPVAQIALLRQELVDRDRWTTPQRFLRALAVYQVLPGPEATELCCWFGLLARGRIGSLLAGLGFVLPGFLLMWLCAYLYVAIGLGSPRVAAAFAGMQPAVVALIARAVPRIGRHAVRDAAGWIAAAGGAIGELAELPFALPLVFGALLFALAPRGRGAVIALVAAAVAAAILLWPEAAAPRAAVAAAAADATAGAATPSFARLLGLGLQAGLLTFGGAYTAIPFVRNDAVVAHGWLTEAQFLDGLAVGGVLPAPLVIFGTFTGYVAAALPGALAMTIGIFAPAFSFTLLGHGLIERMIAHRPLHAALDGVAAAVVGLIAATAGRLLVAHVRSPFAVVVFALALAALLRWRSPWTTPAIVAGGALAGLLAP